MKITFDKEADALYIRLLEGEYKSRVVRLIDDIALDFAAGEKLVGIEVLGASRLFEKKGRACDRAQGLAATYLVNLTHPVWREVP